jgi:hypothetical protein
MSQTEKNLTLYPPKSVEIADKMDKLRYKVIELGNYLEEELLPGRELSLALTKLEELTFFAIAAVARNQEAYNHV